MDAKKMFRALVMGGAAMVMGTLGCGSSTTGGTTTGGGNTTPPPVADAGSATDAGTPPPPADAGTQCVCMKDPTWPGNDCGPSGGTMVCCWLHPTATCCPG